MKSVLSLLTVLMILSGCTSEHVQNMEVLGTENEAAIDGLSVHEKMVIWDDYVRAQDKARLDVTQSFEMLNPNDPKYADMRTEFDHDLYVKQFDERESLIKSKQEGYEKEVAEKHGLTHEQLKNIGDEGMQKEWPFPPEPEGLWNQ